MLCDNSDSPGYAEHHEVLFHIHIHKPYSVVAYVYDCTILHVFPDDKIRIDFMKTL